MKNLIVGFPALIMLLCVSLEARSESILFNDFGPGYSSQLNWGWAIDTHALKGGYEIANVFSPSTTGAVSSVSFGITLPAATDSVIVELMTDKNGSPGSVLETYRFANQVGLLNSQNAPLVSPSLNRPILVAGTQYWMAISPGNSDTYAEWYWNNQGVNSSDFYKAKIGDAWTYDGIQTVGAFEVLGVASTVSTPEPATLTMLGVGITCLAGYGWRRRKQSVPT